MEANMRTCSHLLTISSLLVVLVLPAAPAVAGGPDWFGLHLGSDGFGLSLGFGNWAVYGNSWHDPHWQVDYHSSLNGYGEWIQVNSLGQVWRPYVAGDWRPFNHGRWVYSSYGWTWVSYEPWGYFPHHYGSWALTNFGWVWSPGYSYHPGNVVWVDSGGYVGWYASPPRGWSHAHRSYHHGKRHIWNNGYRHGHHDGYRHGHHDGYRRGYDNGYWDGWRDARYATFVARGHLNSDNCAHHALSVDRVSRTVTRTSVRPMQAAPSRSDVGRWSGRRVEEIRMEQRSVRTADRQMTIARPRGIERSIERHGGETVDRALSRDVASRFKETRGAMDRRTPAVRDSGSYSGRPAVRDGAGKGSPSEHKVDRRAPGRETPGIARSSRSSRDSEEAKDRSRAGRDLSRSPSERRARPEPVAIGRSQGSSRGDASRAPSRSRSGKTDPTWSGRQQRSEGERDRSRSVGRADSGRTAPSKSGRSDGGKRSQGVQPSRSESPRSGSRAEPSRSSRSSEPRQSRSTSSRSTSRKQQASSRPPASSSKSSGSSSKSGSSKPKRRRR